MSEEWVQTSERLLKQMEKFSTKKEKDRLDVVQSIRFSIYALHRSLLGWMNWVNNPDIMATFKKEEMEEMEKRLAQFTESFIKYDVEVTQMGAQKNLEASKPQRELAERRSLEDIFYV